MLQKHLDGFANFVASSHDGVQQEHLSLGNVGWELGKYDPRKTISFTSFILIFGHMPYQGTQGM